MSYQQTEAVRSVEDAAQEFRADIVRGLSGPHKRLSSKYLYDRRGSELFNKICDLPEYYLSRAEKQILESFAGEISREAGPQALLIEYGSGSSVKTQLLLDALQDPVGYIPVEIAAEQLEEAVERLSQLYPKLEIAPLRADYTEDFIFPTTRRKSEKKVVFFPGSTIGNFHPTQAQAFLVDTRRRAGTGSGLLVGVDLQKDPRILHRAYNDAQGLTAAFNLNLLERINRELDGDFETGNFAHYAPYNPKSGRVEMHLVSLGQQVVHVGEPQFFFAAGESIFTESCYKYTIDQFSSVAFGAGYLLRRCWTDPNGLFSEFYFEAM